ncbi:MAG: hypothetical protein M1827_007310 [Pycnora praestabilis]|nr:MAG: hypothetical protein M1827_007310 [Pycnora praestabilis]
MAKAMQRGQDAIFYTIHDGDPLHQRLDELLEKYLNLLDEYQQLRSKLASRLSSGYISLAQANFLSPNRIRYGQDFYDERMQASRRFSIIPSPSHGAQGARTNVVTIIDAHHHESSIAADMDSEESPDLRSSVETEGVVKEKSEKAPASHLSQDPLRWFGILVPPSLRSAQADFNEVVEDSIPKLVLVTQKLAPLENEIYGIREKLTTQR